MASKLCCWFIRTWPSGDQILVHYWVYSPVYGSVYSPESRFCTVSEVLGPGVTFQDPQNMEEQQIGWGGSVLWGMCNDNVVLTASVRTLEEEPCTQRQAMWQKYISRLCDATARDRHNRWLLTSSARLVWLAIVLSYEVVKSVPTSHTVHFHPSLLPRPSLRGWERDQTWWGLLCGLEGLLAVEKEFLRRHWLTRSPQQNENLSGPKELGLCNQTVSYVGGSGHRIRRCMPQRFSCTPITPFTASRGLHWELLPQKSDNGGWAYLSPEGRERV